MSEEISKNSIIGSDKSTIEAEIAELSSKIDEKRRLLETEKGVIEEKEIVRQALAEKISPSAPSSGPVSQVKVVTTSKSHVSGNSYLDGLDEESLQQVQRLVGIVFDRGFDAAVKEASNMEAFIIDAFHDALVDRLYDELKSRGIVK